MIATLHRSLCEFDSLFVDVIDCIDTIYAMSVLLKENLTEPIVIDSIAFCPT